MCPYFVAYPVCESVNLIMITNFGTNQLREMYAPFRLSEPEIFFKYIWDISYFDLGWNDIQPNFDLRLKQQSRIKNYNYILTFCEEMQNVVDWTFFHFGAMTIFLLLVGCVTINGSVIVGHHLANY